MRTKPQATVPPDGNVPPPATPSLQPDLPLRTALACHYTGLTDFAQWDDQVFGLWGGHWERRRVPDYELSLDAVHMLERQLGPLYPAYLARLERHCALAFAAGQEPTPHAATCGPRTRAGALLELAVSTSQGVPCNSRSPSMATPDPTSPSTVCMARTNVTRP